MTRRQQIIEILLKEEKSAQELANYFRVELSEIPGDLFHVEKSIKPRKLKSKPAFCKGCSFVFRERSRVKKPTKCPRCKSEWIEAQRFWIG